LATWITGTVIKKICWTNELFSLRIKVQLPPFNPGQFVRVGLDIEGERIGRPYSLVNAPEDELLEIFFNIVPEGPLSPALAKLQEGDEIYLGDRAHGFLTLDSLPPSRYLWMLATGTGVGPFLSILRSGDAWDKYERIILAYSVKTKREQAYLEDILNLVEKNHPKLNFLSFITQENVPGTFNKRITTALESGELGSSVGLTPEPETSHFMMCGNSNMIKDVSEFLGELGMQRHLRHAPGHITTEKYH
jgi:ferredoxin--NADP+ reductase